MDIIFLVFLFHYPSYKPFSFSLPLTHSFAPFEFNIKIPLCDLIKLKVLFIFLKLNLKFVILNPTLERD